MAHGLHSLTANIQRRIRTEETIPHTKPVCIKIFSIPQTLGVLTKEDCCNRESDFFIADKVKNIVSPLYPFLQDGNFWMGGEGEDRGCSFFQIITHIEILFGVGGAGRGTEAVCSTNFSEARLHFLCGTEQAFNPRAPHGK